MKICSFIIADEEIFIAIRNKAQNSNTAIFILTQLDQKKLTDQSALFNYLTEEEISQNSTQSHLRKIKKLYENGIHISASASVHAKFIIADRTRALTIPGSEELTIVYNPFENQPELFIK